MTRAETFVKSFGSGLVSISASFGWQLRRRIHRTHHAAQPPWVALFTPAAALIPARNTSSSDQVAGPGAQADPSATAEARAEHLTGAVYGTVVVAGVLAAATNDAQPSAGDTGVYVLATVIVFWLAHAWARSLGQRATGLSVTGRVASLAEDWP